MPITRVGVASVAAAAAANAAFVLPAGIQDGDVIYLAIAKLSSAAPTVPSGQGYALLDPFDVNGSSLWLFTYGAVLQAADSGATHTFTFASIGRAGVAIILRGCDPGQLLDVTDPPTAGSANSGTTITCAASAAVSPGAWALWFPALAASATMTFPATNNGNAVTREFGSTAAYVGLGRAEYPTAGTVSALAVTASTGGRSLGKTLLAKPAPVPTALQRWTGSAWQAATVQRWDGGAWVPATVKRWNGGSWS